MLFPFRRLTEIKYLSIFLTVCIGVAAMAMNQGRLTTRSLTGKQESNATMFSSTRPQLHQQKTIEVVVVTLDSSGFFPNKVALPKKKFVLTINNRTGKPTETVFELFREKTSKLEEVTLKRETMSLQSVLDLPPGNYELRAQNNPKWLLILTDKK